MSVNQLKLRAAFAEVLHIPECEITPDIAYDKTKGWDSVAHMALVASLESTFEIMMDTDDVLDLSTFAKAMEILPKYGIAF